MKKVFDVIDEIHELAVEFFYTKERKPFTVALSRSDYRQLVVISSTVSALGNVIVGTGAIHEVETPVGTLRVSIDESLPDTEIVIS